MSKILIYSDIHIAQHKKSMERLQDCLQVQDWIFKVARDRSIKDIVFIGDLFQDREKIDILTYHLAFDIFNKNCSDLNLWLLLGNHDLWYYDKWDISSVKPFSAISNITVIEKPCSIEIAGHILDFLPFTHDPLKYIKTLENSCKDRDGLRILFAHLSIDGAKTNTFYSIYSDVIIEHDGDMVRVGPDLFNSWDKVWLGHYHGAQKINNLEYIGSPLQLTFGEAFQEKHIAIYDLEDGSTEYIENDFSPKHLILNEKNLDKYDLENNFVKISVKNANKGDIVDFRKSIEKNKPTTLEIVSVQEDQSEHFIEDAKDIISNEKDMLEKYIDQVDTGNLCKDRLLEIGKLICQSPPEE